MKRIFFFAAVASTEEMASCTNVPEGAINGRFTINASGDQVYFSQGNLQYQALSGKWRFAPNQWDCIGNDNAKISSSYIGWIDLFGWGTSGWNCGNTYYQPYSIGHDNYCCYGYGPRGLYNLTGDYVQSDWGVHNAISNGGNAAGLWRTLTHAEWRYLFIGREGASGKWGYASVNGVKGLILLPDSFTDPMKNGGSGAFSASHSSWSGNNYSGDNWTAMETAGAVFLPAAGNRSGTSVYDVGSNGGYWSSSYYSSSYAWGVYFLGGDLNAESLSHRYGGFSVRLVRG